MLDRIKANHFLQALTRTCKQHGCILVDRGSGLVVESVEGAAHVDQWIGEIAKRHAPQPEQRAQTTPAPTTTGKTIRKPAETAADATS